MVRYNKYSHRNVNYAFLNFHSNLQIGISEREFDIDNMEAGSSYYITSVSKLSFVSGPSNVFKYIFNNIQFINLI